MQDWTCFQLIHLSCKLKWDLSVASTSFSSENAMNGKLSKNLSCPMLNEMYFSVLLAMQKLFPFAMCIFAI